MNLTFLQISEYCKLHKGSIYSRAVVLDCILNCLPFIALPLIASWLTYQHIDIISKIMLHQIFKTSELCNARAVNMQIDWFPAAFFKLRVHFLDGKKLFVFKNSVASVEIGMMNRKSLSCVAAQVFCVQRCAN